MKITYGIQRRITVTMIALTLFVSLVFSGFSFMLLYSMEDEFFDWQLAEEVAFLQRQAGEGREKLTTSMPHFKLYKSVSEFPRDLKAEVDLHPNRTEFFGGEGRHYHVRYLDRPVSRYLVAEVSEQLFVRPAVTGYTIMLLVISLLVSLVALAMAYRVSRSTIQPLEKLANTVGKVSPESLPVDFADEYPSNEVGQLARALEMTLARTREFIEREQHFTRDASHELRTPITVIQGAAELLAQDPELGGQSAALVKRIDNALLQMGQTVETLLSLAREESAAVGSKPCRLLPLVEEVVLQQSPKLGEKAVEVEISVSEEASVPADPAVLRILLQNLVGNAFQYTDAGEVSIAHEAGTVAICNTSVGQPGDGTQPKGFGIGLTIVERLCERYGIGFIMDYSDGQTRVKLQF